MARRSGVVPCAWNKHVTQVSHGTCASMERTKSLGTCSRRIRSRMIASDVMERNVQFQFSLDFPNDLNEFQGNWTCSKNLLFKQTCAVPGRGQCQNEAAFSLLDGRPLSSQGQLKYLAMDSNVVAFTDKFISRSFPLRLQLF